MTGNWNLNVAVRVCPENETEKSIVDILEEKDQIVVNKDGESNNFTFSHIFPGKATQNDVYNKCVQPLIGNILKVRVRKLYCSRLVKGSCLIDNIYIIHILNYVTTYNGQ